MQGIALKNFKLKGIESMRILILIQLLAGFMLAFIGVIIMFHLGEVWLGLSISLVGFYAVIRATTRDTTDKTSRIAAEQSMIEDNTLGIGELDEKE